MIRYVIDTNVPIVANGRFSSSDQRPPSIDCRAACVRFLQSILKTGTVLVDISGEIEAEYRKHLNARGQPGVGDRFFQQVINSAPKRIERVDIPKGVAGEYIDLPQQLIDANFDRSDRKFAALAKKQNARVANATDSDWLIHRTILQRNGIKLKFVCGCDPQRWFVEGSLRERST